jgi:FkbM family methyltransferase
MDLVYNADPRFTKYIIESGAMNGKFVVVDVGVYGGENPRWHFLGDQLVLHGFDAIKEVSSELNEKEKLSPNKRYHWMAIADYDGEKEFYFTPSNPTNSSFGRPASSRHADGTLSFETRMVPVRSLDSLLASGTIPAPNFLKVDVEGYEKLVFLGAKECLSRDLLGIEFETSFNTGPEYPNSHLGTLQESLLPRGFLLFDLNFDRVPRASFRNARQSSGLTPANYGRPATVNALFCRDLISEADGVLFGVPPRIPSLDEIIKIMIIYELHGLNDIAFDTATRFSSELHQRLDIDRAKRLLLGEDPVKSAAPVSVEARLQAENAKLSSQNAALEARAFEAERTVQDMLAENAKLSNQNAALEARAFEAERSVQDMLASTSWRITSPLRAIKNLLP